MDEEIRFHIEMEAEKYIGVESHREVLREARRLSLLEDLWRDLCYAARSLRFGGLFARVARVDNGQLHALPGYLLDLFRRGRHPGALRFVLAQNTL